MTDSSPDPKALLEAFTRLGVDSPEGWVESQIEEGIPQLHRASFLVKAWSAIPDGGSNAWLDELVSGFERDPSGPYSGAGKAIASLRAKGASDSELTDLVRAMQAELLFHVSYLLADPDFVPDERFDDPLLKAARWILVTLDDEDQIGQPIDDLHESVAETDPTGREVGPLE